MRKLADHLGRVESRQPEHAAARKERAVAGHEEAVNVVERQGVQQHVPPREAPGIDEGQCVARQVAVGEHCTFRATGRARGVNDRRQVVRPGNDGIESLGRGACELEQGSFVAGKSQDGRLGPECGDGGEILRAADYDARLGIAEKIRQLAFLIGGVQRQIDEARAQAR